MSRGSRKPEAPAALSQGGPGGEIVLYRAADGTVSLDVRLERDTLWLTQKQISVLFDTERSVITKHLRNTSSPVASWCGIQYVHFLH